jgi:hypothetical protein
MRFSLRWGGVACGLFLAVAAHATSVPRLSFEELTDRSEVIATGQITRAWSDWDVPHSYIWTHYELAVASAWKGKPASTVIISEPGGIVGGIGMSVEEAVSYKAGDQVLVFLERMPNGYLRTTGWGQGQYRLDQRGSLHASESLRGMTTLEGRTVSDISTRIAARVRLFPGVHKGLVQ